jgi:hypothetical protein
MVVIPNPPPEVRTMLVEDLLHEVRVGRLRKPTFQRMFVWRREDVIALFDSIFKGYPIGSLIFWERPSDISMEEVRELPTRMNAWYVIDGQQRLRTLTSTLEPGPTAPFDIAFDLDTEQFVRADERSDSLLPLHLVLDTAALLDHLRELPGQRRRTRIDAANRVARAVRDYRFPITIVRGDDAQAEEVFRRLNERGAPLTWVDVQHAIRWRSENTEEVSKDQILTAIRHLRRDAYLDTLADPWSWTELAAVESNPELLLSHLRSSSVTPAIPLDVPRGLVGRRPAVVLHPLDRLAYQVLVDIRVNTLHESLSENVYGYRVDRRRSGPRQYVDQVWASRAWQARQKSWPEDGYSCRTDIAAFFESISIEQIDDVLASAEGYAGNSRLLSLLRGWSGRGNRGGLPQRCLPSFVLANALLIGIDTELSGISGLNWARWVDDYALHSANLDTVLDSLQTLNKALGRLGLRLSPGKTRVGSPENSVFTDPRLEDASGEVATEAEVDPEDADVFVQLCDEILAAPWTASVRNISFVVTRLKCHPELFDESRWAMAARRMPHAAEHLARLARHCESFRSALEAELPGILEGPWVGHAWSQVKLLGAWRTVPTEMAPLLQHKLEHAVDVFPAIVPTLAFLLASEISLSKMQELAASSNDWLSHRALWLCAGRAGAPHAWLDEQLARFEAHGILRAAWELQGPALFEPCGSERPEL